MYVPVKLLEYMAGLDLFLWDRVVSIWLDGFLDVRSGKKKKVVNGVEYLILDDILPFCLKQFSTSDETNSLNCEIKLDR